MKLARLLPLLALPSVLLADEAATFTVETYALPAAVWLKIPTTMRDDHALLRTTLIEQLPKGKITLRDRIGGPGRGGQRISFETLHEVFIPKTFDSSETNLFTAEWETREVGSSLEVDGNYGKSMGLAYRLVDPAAPVKPLLASGERLDQERSAMPVFPRVEFDGTVPIAAVTLVSVAPDPDPQLREKQLLVSFLVTNPLPDDEESVRKREPGFMVELLGIQGSTRTTEIPALELMKNLLRRNNAVVFLIGTNQVPGRRTSLEAVQEIPYPSRAEKGTSGPVPTALTIANVGTVASVHITPAAAGKVATIIQVNHDWRDPVLPVVPGEGEELINRDQIPYTMQLRARQDVPLGEWALVARQPLSEIFPADDRATKGESCYLFARIVKGN